MTNQQTIDHLTKITLILDTNAQNAKISPLNHKPAMTIVYGIGPQGLTAFEQQLHGKQAGDTLTMRIERHSLPKEFEHLAMPLITAMGSPPPFDLEIRIESVASASDMEIMKALAKSAESSGCGGGCGCGC